MDFAILVRKIDNFNNVLDKQAKPCENSSNINVILKNKVPDIKKENYRGNQYEMDQFNWELQKKEYYNKMRRERLGRKEKETTEVESVYTLQDILTKDQYSKKWNKLDLFCKKEKFKQYIKKLTAEQLIEKDEEKLYLNYLYKMLNKKVLTKASEVDYSIDLQKIIKIPILDKKIKALSA